MLSRSVIFGLISVGIVLLFLLLSDLSYIEIASIGLFFFAFLDLIEKFGKKLIVLELFTVMALLQWLIAPILFYHIYTENYYLARLWVKFMPIPSTEYYPFAFFCFLAMVAGFNFPLTRFIPGQDKKDLRQYEALIPQIMQGKKQIVWALFGIGWAASFFLFFAPDSLRNVLYMLSLLIYVGYAYWYLSDMPYKGLASAVILFLIAVESLSSGMFGDSFFLVIFLGMVISTRMKPLFSTKLSTAIGLFLFILILQGVKKEYRQLAWSKGSASFQDFTMLMGKQASDLDGLFRLDNFFFIAMRFNQGWHIATTMYHVPQNYPYAHGQTILNSVLATLIPRFLWPDKPMSGGKENLKRFWGYETNSTSMNLSPAGEAYANFGRFSGVLFMFFFGLLLNIIINAILNWTTRRPTIICWFPLLFISIIGSETDTLMVLNSVFKGIIFVSAILLGIRMISHKNI